MRYHTSAYACRGERVVVYGVEGCAQTATHTNTYEVPYVH
jgi:hypothetical protein